MLFWALVLNLDIFLSFPSLSCLLCCRRVLQNQLLYIFSSLCQLQFMSGRPASITWSVWMLKSRNILQFSFCTTDSGWCSYHFSFTLIIFDKRPNVFVFQSSHVVSCTLSVPFCYTHWEHDSLFHRRPHILYLLSSRVLSILALITLVRIACSCAAVINDSVSLLIPVLLSQSHLSFPASS